MEQFLQRPCQLSSSSTWFHHSNSGWFYPRQLEQELEAQWTLCSSVIEQWNNEKSSCEQQLDFVCPCCKKISERWLEHPTQNEIEKDISNLVKLVCSNTI